MRQRIVGLRLIFCRTRCIITSEEFKSIKGREAVSVFRIPADEFRYEDKTHRYFNIDFGGCGVCCGRDFRCGKCRRCENRAYAFAVGREYRRDERVRRQGLRNNHARTRPGFEQPLLGVFVGSRFRGKHFKVGSRSVGVGGKSQDKPRSRGVQGRPARKRSARKYVGRVRERGFYKGDRKPRQSGDIILRVVGTRLRNERVCRSIRKSVVQVRDGSVRSKRQKRSGRDYTRDKTRGREVRSGHVPVQQFTQRAILQSRSRNERVEFAARVYRNRLGRRNRSVRLRAGGSVAQRRLADKKQLLRPSVFLSQLRQYEQQFVCVCLRKSGRVRSQLLLRRRP